VKAYHISFVFDQPQPGVITIPAYTSEEAEQSLRKMLEGFSNVKIMQVTDLEEIPFLKKMFEQQQPLSPIIDIDPEDVEDNTVVEFKKPN